MTWRAYLGMDEPDQIPHWTPQRAQREERIHLERLGLAGFHFAWWGHLKAPHVTWRLRDDGAARRSNQ